MQVYYLTNVVIIVPSNNLLHILTEGGHWLKLSNQISNFTVVEDHAVLPITKHRLTQFW